MMMRTMLYEQLRHDASKNGLLKAWAADCQAPRDEEGDRGLARRLA
jgi:hypothetical protein